MHYVTAVRFDGGETEAQITWVRWLNATDGIAGSSTVAAMIAWLDKGNTLYVGGRSGRVRVGVVRRADGAPYLRTYANKEWTDNLLGLPRY